MENTIFFNTAATLLQSLENISTTDVLMSDILSDISNTSGGKPTNNMMEFELLKANAVVAIDKIKGGDAAGFINCDIHNGNTYIWGTTCYTTNGIRSYMIAYLPREEGVSLDCVMVQLIDYNNNKELINNTSYIVSHGQKFLSIKKRCGESIDWAFEIKL